MQMNSGSKTTFSDALAQSSIVLLGGPMATICPDPEATKLKLLRSISASVSVAAGGVVRVMIILIGLKRAAVATYI